MQLRLHRILRNKKTSSNLQVLCLQQVGMVDGFEKLLIVLRVSLKELAHFIPCIIEKSAADIKNLRAECIHLML